MTFNIGDIVKTLVMAEDRSYYGIVVSCHNNIYYGIKWLHEQRPPFYNSDGMLHESALKKVS